MSGDGEGGGESPAPALARAISPNLLALVGTVICQAVLNKSLHRMTLVPLGDYVFFIANLLTVC